MRRLALPALALTLAASVYAADYRLTVDAPSQALSRAKAVRVYGLQLAKGDRIVAITTGKGEGTPIRIVLDSKAGPGALLGEIKNDGFSGKLVQAKGAAPERTLGATLSPYVPVAEPGLLDSVLGFFTSMAGFVTMGALAILGAVFYLLRHRSSGEGSHTLPNRRKAIDESLKDIQRRLEKIDENQHQLVKKPPMLRAFRKQIEDFDSRLGAMEGVLKSLQAMLAEQAKGLGAVDRTQKEIQAKAESTDSAVKLISGNLDATRRQVVDVTTALEQTDKNNELRLAEVTSKLEKQSMETLDRFSKIEKAHEQAAASMSGLAEQAKALATRSSVEGLQKQVEQLAEKDVDFSPIQERLTDLPTKEDLEPIQTDLQELQGFVGWLRDEQRSLAQQISDLGSHQVDLSPVEGRLAGLEQLMAADDSRQVLADLSAEVAALPKTTSDLSPLQSGLENVNLRIAELAAKEVDLTAVRQDLTALASAVSELQQKEFDLKPVLERISALEPASYDAELRAIQDSQQQLDADLKQLRAKLSEANPEWDQVRSDHQQFATELAKLHESVAEISNRTDQRESLLLTLQSRVADSESGLAAGAELLPVVADLRLELQSVAAEQSKTSAMLQGINGSIGELRSRAELRSEPKEFDSSVLEAQLASLAEQIANLKVEPTAVQAETVNVDLSGLEAQLKDLGDAIAALEARPEQELPSFDVSHLEQGLHTLTNAFEEFRNQPVPQPERADLSSIEAELRLLATSFEKWQADQPDLLPELASLKHELERQQSEARETEDRLKAELQTVKHAAELKAQAQPKAKPEAAPAEQPKVETKPALVVEEPVLPASESTADLDEDIELEDSKDQNDWRLPGGSRARRWSTQLGTSVSILPSTKNLSPLTPTITPDAEFPVGPILYSVKRVIYSHGNALRSTWPGRGPNSATLQEPVPADPWRLAFIDGHVFCVEDGQVEIVSLATWNVISRFSGDFVDQTSTDTRWVGLGSALGKLYLDYRNLQGRLLGEPVQLPIDSNDGRGIVADGERVFVGSSDGRIVKVENGQAQVIVSAKSENLKLQAFCAVKSGLLALFRGDGKDHIRIYNFDGKLLKQHALDFQHAANNLVVMGDRLYLLDTANKKVVSLSLRKLEVISKTNLPGGFLLAYSGFFHGDQHQLLVTVGNDQTTAKVVMIDIETGSTAAICDANQNKVQALVADGRIVVASSSSYQNSLRIFDPFALEQVRKAA